MRYDSYKEYGIWTLIPTSTSYNTPPTSYGASRVSLGPEQQQ